MLADIIDGADLIGEGPVDTRGRSCGSGVYLLVALPWHSFDRLCAAGGEFEDLEDTHDAEPEVGEPSLGSTEPIVAGWDKRPETLNPANTFPWPAGLRTNGGVAAAEVVKGSQEDWARGSSHDDREYDACDLGEPDDDNEPDERRRPRIRPHPGRTSGRRDRRGAQRL